MFGIQQLYKTFGLKHVLRGLNFDFQKDCINYVLGPSGSGKTTLLHILSGSVEPTSGKIIFGSQAHSITPSWIRKQMGIVYQDFRLFSHYNVLKNICYPLAIRGYSKRESLKRAQELGERFSITDLFSAWPQELSGGQKQRVAIARALVHNPVYIFADEPTGSLDEDNARIIFAALRDLAQEGKWVIVVTHDRLALKEYSSESVLFLSGNETSKIDNGLNENRVLAI